MEAVKTLKNLVGGQINEDLIAPHTAYTSHVAHTGGPIAGIDTLIHYEHLGGGKVNATVEYRQDVKPIAQYNEILRNLPQGSWGDKLGRMTYNIPKVVIHEWKNKHGFDFDLCDLNDPIQYKRFKALVDLPEYRYCKTWVATK